MAKIYRSTAVSNAAYGTPDISGLIVTAFSVNETASVTETKDDQGGVVAVAVSDSIKDISISGMRTGSFSQTVGGTLSITMPAGTSLGATTIVTGITTSFAAEQFETIEVTAKSYSTTMTVAASTP
jgi:hypothetical protein